jgi:hypothetical protein
LSIVARINVPDNGVVSTEMSEALLLVDLGEIHAMDVITINQNSGAWCDIEEVPY